MASRSDEVIAFFSIYLISPVALGPGVYSVTIRNEYQKKKTTNSVALSPRANYTEQKKNVSGE
jgi:hypothetical protein